jgi:hypothetical protein
MRHVRQDRDDTPFEMGPLLYGRNLRGRNMLPLIPCLRPACLLVITSSPAKEKPL